MAVGNLSIVGLGLIGASVALEARSRKLVRSVTAFDTHRETLEEALATDVIDAAAASLEEACRGADVIILAVPVLSIAPLAARIIDLADPGSIITDVGSTKESIVSAMDALPKSGCAFVGGHPIAGVEHSGFGAARKGLFSNAPFVVTPTRKTDPDAVTVVEQFWKHLGCRIYRLSPSEHDRLFSLISHLPHILAYALVSAVFSGTEGSGTFQDFAGGGFRDFTRISASDPVMWRDICLDNRENILRALDALENELSSIRRAIAGGHENDLENIFRTARNLKTSRSE